MNRLSTALAGLLVAAVALLAGVAVQAQDAYPSRAVSLVVPYPPGGSADILARAVGAELGKRLGQPVVIDNRGGAGTAIGTKIVAGAAPDGYTLLLGTVSSQAMNPAMNKVAYDPLKDFTPISPLASIPFVLVANPAAQIDSVAALIARAKAQPDGLSYASAGPGTSNHLAAELFASDAQVRLLHVPYKGSAPALNDVIAGVVPLMFDLQATTLPYLKSGKLKALAVTSRTRSSLLPDVPTLSESGLAGYEVSAWFGLFAPAGLPAPILEQLNAAVTSILETPDMVTRLRQLGAEPQSGDPISYAAYARRESVKWTEVVKRYGLAP
ncbi:tripartite tricarboxylate transporter substrate binding protein [Vineibacter terrae]|uniref:tripartite tricarboxylate transporter substrate binding protein n=1 Tax=Vineibacter terrae TaxID=2586908 RepID=UPI002E36F3F8|nr:tripartite tricarboxylate transporter substrate binding protein [Vineibacter terrae]HEX2891936.1 tripartite tricarboxylate transporter substrate binding protein [Vineibacter terrae]